MNIHYELTIADLYLDQNPYMSYGVLIRDTETDAILHHVPDISLEREQIAELVSLCNALELSPIHLWDVIVDMLSDS